MRLLRRVGLGILLLIIVTVGIAFGYDRYASQDVATMYPPDGDILTVAGVDVHTVCRGTGDETLLTLASAETDVPEGQAFYESLRALHDTYPQSTLITIPDARHYAIVTHVDQLKEHVLDWMDAQ